MGPRRGLVTVVAALTLLGLGGCGVKTIYNNADRVARWVASDYVDFTPEQRAWFDAEIARFMHWHRTTELPEYRRFLDRLPEVLGDGTTAAEVDALAETIFLWGERMQTQALPLLTTLSRSLTDEQVAELPARLERANREFAEDEAGLTLDEARDAWWRGFVDDFERFSGRLDDDQRAYVESASVRYLPDRVLWIVYRERWQQDLLELLQQRRSPDFAPAFRALVERRRSYYGEELRAVFDNNERLYADVTAWLLNHLDPRQQERFFERLSDYALDFAELAAAAPAEPPPPAPCLVDCAASAASP